MLFCRGTVSLLALDMSHFDLVLIDVNIGRGTLSTIGPETSSNTTGLDQCWDTVNFQSRIRPDKLAVLRRSWLNDIVYDSYRPGTEKT
jgi:hypothetical protein